MHVVYKSVCLNVNHIDGVCVCVPIDRSCEVGAKQSFWLSQEYYDSTVNAFKTRLTSKSLSSTPPSSDDD